MAHSRSFLANQKARNAIVGTENLLNEYGILWKQLVMGIVQCLLTTVQLRRVSIKEINE